MKAELKTNIGGASLRLSEEIKNIEDYHKFADFFQQIVDEERALTEDEENYNNSPIKKLNKQL